MNSGLLKSLACNPKNRYKIYSFETGKTLGIFSGKTLIEKGITVTIPTTYTAEVLTIEKPIIFLS
jgi:hypothetical protein